MRYLLLIIIFLLSVIHAQAQIENFPKIDISDLSKESYEIDSNATAIVLLEQGKTYIESSNSDGAYMVFHQYKVRIKILKQEGYNEANFTIPLYKFGSTFEYIQSIKGTTYNLQEGHLESSTLEQKNVYTDQKSEYLKFSKFTMPNIKVGSVIDVEYTIVSPDIFNFRTWNFQANIPKLKSNYNVLIPAVYKYNVILKGFLKLKDTQSKIDRECLSIFNTRVDCSNITYSMENIPAFVEENFMLAPKNYLSAIYFELEEAYRPGGAKQSFTKQWKDVDRELLSEKTFGGQLKKVNIFKDKISPEILTTADNHERANKIYTWIQNNIKWNNYYGKYAQRGVEDALTNKNGNIADINLALITALNAANIEAYPIIISTRDNSLPHDLHPVISDFNYVIVGAKLNNEIIQLDASDRLLPFGQLPLRAINGQGRIIYSKKSSEWVPLENKIISITSYNFDGKLGLDGYLYGKLNIVHNGLDAYNKRREILDKNSIDEYIEKLDERLTSIDIEKYNISFLEEIDNSLNIETEVKIKFANQLKPGNFYINPIFIDRTTRNPFNLDERTFPVDLGAKRNETYEINIEMPPNISLINAPKNSNMTLPDNSARFIYKSNFKDNKLYVIQHLSLNKSTYSTDEYFGLKELFSRIIQQSKVDYSFKYDVK